MWIKWRLKSLKFISKNIYGAKTTFFTFFISVIEPKNGTLNHPWCLYLHIHQPFGINWLWQGWFFVTYQCFQFSAICFLSGNLTWFFNFRGKKRKYFFFFVKIFFGGKKLLRVTIFCRQNGGWTHLHKKNKKSRRKWRTHSSAQGEQGKKKENGVRTPLVPKEGKRGLKEPQKTIFHLLTDKIGCKWEYCRDASIPRYRGIPR